MCNYKTTIYRCGHTKVQKSITRCARALLAGRKGGVLDVKEDVKDIWLCEECERLRVFFGYGDGGVVPGPVF